MALLTVSNKYNFIEIKKNLTYTYIIVTFYISNYDKVLE